ncbi:amino acid adenylation domain-containing protein [Streptomyces sp. NPDC001401]|uniref:non-ribosomal peptide synthetase n=1 Tax=Streptomyces sp. NPDC001401 TaxID=3364570 RepID=UPI0036B8D1C9
MEELQGRVRPVAADEVIRGLREHYRGAGDRVAVVEGGRTWTYAELGNRVFGLAHRLGEAFPARSAEGRGVFGVAIDRSLELLVAVHAIALTGSAYCPIGPDDPVPWQLTVAQTSNAEAVLVAGDAEDHQAIQEAFGKTFLVRRDKSAATDFTHARVHERTTSQVIFTSGSAGRPKGVLCTYGGFANRIRWMQERFPLRTGDRVALKTPVTFDVAGWEMFWPQYAGAQTVIVPPGAHTSPEALISTFNQHAVTVAHFVPSMLRLWLRADGARRCPDLRMVFSSGEVLDAALVAEFARQSKGELHNLYGPTEATIDVTHFAASAEPRRPVPIGRPITNTRIYVLDQAQRVCPVGESGEIYIQGIGVASGYLNASEEDSARFLPVLRDAPPGWGTFRTGDLGRYTTDGQIEFHGRLDGQLKIRGQRVEPAEVEAALCEHSAVVQAHARAHRSSMGRPLLVAYVVLDASHGMTDPVGELQEHLACHLPTRSMPSKFVFLDPLPLSSHGKVDASRLPEPGRARPDLKSPFEEPTKPLEKLIAGIWAHVLDLDEVGVRDNFHDLGGDSLAAVEISFVLTERLNLDHDDPLIPRILMDGSTVAQSAAMAALAGVKA